MQSYYLKTSSSLVLQISGILCYAHKEMEIKHGWEGTLFKQTLKEMAFVKNSISATIVVVVLPRRNRNITPKDLFKMSCQTVSTSYVLVCVLHKKGWAICISTWECRRKISLLFLRLEPCDVLRVLTHSFEKMLSCATISHKRHS